MPGRTEEEKRTTLVYGYADNFKTFDPARQVFAQETAIIQQVLEPLVLFNQDLVLTPRLAIDWSTSDDCNSWVFRLRPNVFFHDGTEFTSDAVKAHFERVLDPVTASTRAKNYEDIDTIETPDPLTVVFRLKRQNCIFPEKLSAASASIPSPAAVEKYGAEIRRNPVGTGAFEFVEWRTDQYIKLKRFDRYWNAENIHIENLEFRPVAENTTRLILLEQGVIDMADISFAHVNVAKSNDRIVVQSAPHLSIRYIGFNTQKPPFNDVRVRRAANHAVNKADMMKYMFFGVGEPARGPIPSVLPAFNPDIEGYEYDPEKAKALLAEAGFGPDNPLKTQIWTYESGQYRVAADAVVGDLRRVNMDISMRVIDNAAYWSKFDEFLTRSGEMYPTKEGVYEMYVGGWVGGETAHGFLENLFKHGSYSNSSFYHNPEVEELLVKFKTIVDDEERNAVYRRMQELIVEDAPWIFAFHGQLNVGLQKHVQGYRISPSGLIPLEGVRLVPGGGGDS